jgi:hypothetical protein
LAFFASSSLAALAFLVGSAAFAAFFCSALVGFDLAAPSAAFALSLLPGPHTTGGTPDTL